MKMDMEVNIALVDGDMQFEAKNANGNAVLTDGSANKKGMRPMELLLSAVGTCSAFDAVHILRKQRQQIDTFTVEVKGKRPAEGAPRPFTAIHAHFRLSGDNLDLSKVERAVALSMEKYCSASATLSDKVNITHSVEIV